jgi:N-acyl-D-amino-acid deacylase
MTREALGRVILLASCLSSVSPAIAGDEPAKAVRMAVERGLTVLERGAREYPSHQSCFACHHQTLPLLAMKTARDAGLRFNEELFKDQQKFTRKSFDERKERLAKGEHVGGRAATVSFGLWTLSICGDPQDYLGEAMTAYLLSVQQPNGSWKAQSNRPPLEGSLVSCTVLSAIGMKRFATPAQQEKVTEALARANAFLASAALDEQEDLNFALWAEKLLDGTPERRQLLRDKILAARRADGGWSQLSTLNSDAYATGQTLYVLLDTGTRADEAPVREAVAFLLEKQEQDGSWHVVTRSKPIQPWFDNGDPHDKDQFISIAATAWATAALAKSIQPLER